MTSQPRPAAKYAELDLSGVFKLSSADRADIDLPISLPGDVHTALLEAGVIPDPYFGTNEMDIMWVNRARWSVERSFDVPPEMATGHLTLTLSEVDCIATISLNGAAIAEVDNQFVRHDLDVTGKVRPGANTLRIDFDVARDVAAARAAAHPFPLPFTKNYQTNGLEGVAMNFIRKTACHAGWDWGICLMPTGVYGAMVLRRSPLARQDSVQVAQRHADGACDLTVSTRVFAFAAGEVELIHKIDGQTVGGKRSVAAGENVFKDAVTIVHPTLWWPNGQGDQPLYTLETSLDGEKTVRRLGLRQLDWVVEKDEIDHNFKCRINGRDITMMGANWIPNDAIPSRITQEAVRDVLESAKAANMNMLRIWGGGQYEPDWFYDLCDELGILIWHDFMFACMPYPSDEPFLASVRAEAIQQVRRLQHHASIALWCGDNEVIGSLSWYEETRANPERYIANYDRVSHLLQQIVAAEDPGRRFWPSSPSLGYLDFSDGWHSDTRGDMHFWSVWHEAKPFEHYRDVNPRFASEFGFQSFTSMNVIESFARPEDRNPSSPVMEQHQRNDGGNARIIETMTRYFRFPKGFAEMVFLSQVQQGLAIKTAIEYWRSTKPRCMGTLFWQINDCWPVHSWSSLDYGGQWKLLHHMARRFFLPVTVVAVPGAPLGRTKNSRGTPVEGAMPSEIVLKGINDRADRVDVLLKVSAVDMQGNMRIVHERGHTLDPDAATELVRLPATALKAGEFLYFAWTDRDGNLIGDNDFFPRAYKYYDLADAEITARWSTDQGNPVLTLSANKPAFFVAATTEVPGQFSDNAITLIPGIDRKLAFAPRKGATADAEALARSLSVTHLAKTC
ncbi:MAG: glycoside hydrolase family 2 protein [Alphaproteobacteria bacterium]|nr:glycoside hydrolase family 2 protein [Alphaproteobacteria bacterium]